MPVPGFDITTYGEALKAVNGWIARRMPHSTALQGAVGTLLLVVLIMAWLLWGVVVSPFLDAVGAVPGMALELDRIDTRTKLLQHRINGFSQELQEFESLMKGERASRRFFANRLSTLTNENKGQGNAIEVLRDRVEDLRDRMRYQYDSNRVSP